ncbi:tyrosine-type recombinase/integrase [Actinocorallia sp. A-T 12471]|uniref:tyrosine-type recombinase/integrase n=1 Tax=Actinocorallia sp. A-T 12471 TaxID=3089813 RepID=UPI0029D3AD45|nr:tyrosine-type recombinase/integrase [Actinocorallia sp. A-T 12471]MDX6743952.1 tyrosine-type recombinase/integrase [Actinocorallia sp. A-T 12471]
MSEKDALVPSAVYLPSTGARPPRTVRLDDGREITPPAPMLDSVGAIAGLSPRRERGDGGEVPGADVDLVDALPRELVWPTVAAWLTAAKSVQTRRARLQDVAAFLRWLEVHAPGLALLAVSEDTITGYRESLATGTARAGVRDVGKPLSAASVARRLSTLSSFYKYAMRRAGLRANPADPGFVERPVVSGEGKTPMRTKEEAQGLTSAAGADDFLDRYPADAVCVTLLFMTGMRIGEITALTCGQVKDDSGHRVLVFARKGGRTARVPIPPAVAVLLFPLIAGRPADEPIFHTDDGRPWDRWRAYTALRRAATAANLSSHGLTPHTARATFASLLREAGVPREKVQEAMGHTSSTTTQRYERGTSTLSSHAAYDMERLLEGNL